MSVVGGSNLNNATFAIKLGSWINWDQGPIFGSQITLSARDAQLLSSFLSIFITYVGVQLWQIISYIAHQSRSSNGATDGLHQQIQIVFRNSSSPWSAAKAFCQMLWAWRRNAHSSFARSFFWALLAFMYAIAFGLLSIFAASEITKAPGHGRIIQGEYCGYYGSGMLDQYSNNAWQYGQLQNSYTAAQYAESCYPGNNTASVIQCDVFRKPHLSFDQSHTNTCPFGNNICNMTHTQPVVMDTGLIDSHKDLGINTPEKEKLQYRKRTTCAPLNMTGYTTVVNVTSDDVPYAAIKGDRVIMYNFGPSPDITNFTFLVNTHSSIDQVGYMIHAEYAHAHTGKQGLGFEPIPALNRTDADVMLVGIIFNDIQFQQPCEDPIFTAHDISNRQLPSGQTVTSVFTDHYAGTIACAEQHQFCNPNNKKCTDLAGYSDASLQIYDRLDTNNMQGSVGLRIGSSLSVTSVFNTISGRGASALQAQNSVSVLSQGPLPNNQWEIESSSWFAAGLARLQQEVQQFAARNTNVNVTLPAKNDVMRQMNEYLCQNQITQFTQGTISFSLLGLGIVLCFGVLIIILSYIIEPVVSLCQQKVFKRGIHKHRDWILNEKMQLHRMALEARGIGPWYGTTKEIPVTDRGVVFTGWQESDMVEASYNRPTALQHSQHSEITSVPEGKPFITQQDTAYQGHTGGPTFHVHEY